MFSAESNLFWNCLKRMNAEADDVFRMGDESKRNGTNMLNQVLLYASA